MTVYVACFAGIPEALFLSRQRAQQYLDRRYPIFRELLSIAERRVEA